MTEKKRYRGPQNEDVYLVEVGETPEYNDFATGEVTLVPVISRERVLGFIWYSDIDEAADFLEAASAGADGFNAGAEWNERLLKARKKGLTPIEAVQKYSRFSKPGSGRLDVIKSATVENLEEAARVAAAS